MPLPLAMPPRVQIAPPSGKVTAASFFTVSVVMMASAAKEPPSVDRPATSAGSPASMGSREREGPMTR